MKNTKILKWIFYVCAGLLAMMTLLMWGFASEYETINLILILASLISFGLMGWLERALVLDVVKSKSFKNGCNELIGLFLIFCILGLINYLVYMNNTSVDVTRSKVHTLTDQSHMVLGHFQKKVKLTLFARRAQWDNYFELLKQYKLHNSHIELSAVDVEEQPALAKVQGVSEDGSVVIEYEGRKIIGKADSELAVTNLLLKLQRTRTITIGFTSGHGEIDLSEQERSGGSFLKDKILERNYQLTKVDLLSPTKINPKLDLLMVLGPVNGMLDLEVDKIRDYLKSGGNLVLSLAPNFDKRDWSNFLKLINDYGANIPNTIVLDRLATEQGTDATTPIIVSFNPDNRITADMKGRLVFPISTAVVPVENKSVKYHWLARSTTFPASWAESDLVGVVKGAATVDDKDLKGPVDVAVVMEHVDHNAKVAVWGSTSSLLNGQASNALNFNIFLNAVQWLVDDEGIMALTRPGLTGERIFLSSAQMSLIFWGSIVLIPFCLSVLGIYFYRRRLVK